MENNKYWLHRISHEWDAAYKLLSEGWLTIGWSSLYDSGIEFAQMLIDSGITDINKAFE